MIIAAVILLLAFVNVSVARKKEPSREERMISAMVDIVAIVIFLVILLI